MKNIPDKAQKYPRNIVIIGRGQLGQIFATAALRLGITVHPFLRSQIWDRTFESLPIDTAIFCTVSEDSVDEVIQKIPQQRRDDLIFVQNNFFPKILKSYQIHEENIALIWFAKKMGKTINIAQTSLIYGKHAQLFCDLLQSINVPCETLPSQNDLYQAILDKYVFILTINSLGLIENLTLGDWLKKDLTKVKVLIKESATLGAWHLRNIETQKSFKYTAEKCETAVLGAMHNMSDYFAKGRTAPDRLKTAATEIQEAALNLSNIEHIAASF